MFWRADDAAAFTRTVKLQWTRRAQNAKDGEEVAAVDDAVWRQRGNAHYISYIEPAEGSIGEVRTTLRVEPDALTWIRHGAVNWTHTFREGQTHASRMQITGQTLDIETSTSTLRVNVTEVGGNIRLAYDMTMESADAQTIVVNLSFG